MTDRPIAARLRRLMPPPTSRLPVYAGLVLIGVGFSLLAIAWGDVAGTLDVGEQIPFLLSAGFTGIGLVIVGLGVVTAAVLRTDSARRQRQAEQLRNAIDDLRIGRR